MELISREAVIEAIGDAHPLDYNKQAILERIKALPTIDPEKHGRWEKLDLWTKPVCSVCGEPCFGLHGFSYETTDYCPNCGARMREDGEEG